MPEVLYRELELSGVRATAENVVEASFSSENPIQRYFGFEVLEHTREAVDLDRAASGLPLLDGHDARQQVGIVERIRIVAGKLRGRLRFASHPRAQDLLEMVKDGILRSLSVGYVIHETQPGELDGRTVIRVTRWEPTEVSLVAVPADITVGIGRSVRPVVTVKGETEMPDELETNEDRQRMTPRAARRAERHRAEEILALADLRSDEDPGLRPIASKAVREGWSVEEFRKVLLDRIPKSRPLADPIGPLGMSLAEVDHYSFLRAIRAQMDPRYAQREAGFELECSRAFAKACGREPQGIYVPPEVLRRGRRDLSVGTATAGGHLVATELLASDFITMLRNASRVIELGARVISDLVGDVAIPRQTGGATAYWVTEGNAPTESQQTFDQVTLSPKTVSAYTDYTRKLLLQATPDVEQLVRVDLATILGLEIDRAAINGSGSAAEPTGILNTTGIGSVVGGPNGAAPLWSHLVNLTGALADSNAAQGALAFLTNSKVRSKLLNTAIQAGGVEGNMIWRGGANGDGTLIGFRAAVSNQVPSNLTKGTGSGLSAIIFGNWSDLIIGQWSGLDLLVDPYTLGTSGGVRVIAMQDVDIAIRHAESFAAMQDAITT